MKATAVQLRSNSNQSFQVCFQVLRVVPAMPDYDHELMSPQKNAKNWEVTESLKESLKKVPQRTAKLWNKSETQLAALSCPTSPCAPWGAISARDSRLQPYIAESANDPGASSRQQVILKSLKIHGTMNRSVFLLTVFHLGSQFY